MHQSFATTAPLGPGNSGDIDFSLCKALVYAPHCGDIFYVISLVKVPSAPSPRGSYKYKNQYYDSVSRLISLNSLHYLLHCIGGNQKPGVSTALRGHLLGKNTVLKPRYAPRYPRPHGGRGCK